MQAAGRAGLQRKAEEVEGDPGTAWEPGQYQEQTHGERRGGARRTRAAGAASGGEGKVRRPRSHRVPTGGEFNLLGPAKTTAASRIPQRTKILTR